MRQWKQAYIYSMTDRTEEAWKAYEEMLFSGYQMMNAVFGSLTQLAIKEDDRERAHRLIDKQHQLAKVFEMGAWHEVSGGLELAALERDADTVIEIMSKILDAVPEIYGFAQSDLYRHMTFQKPREEFTEKLRKNMLESFRDEETFGFLKEDARWQKLVRESK